MTKTSKNQLAPSAMCQVASALVFIALQARSPHTGLNRLSHNDALYNLLNYELIASADINRDFINLTAGITQVRKANELEALIYDDYNPSLSEGILTVASDYTVTELNQALALVRSPRFTFRLKRKSRNLRVIFTDSDVVTEEL